MAVAKLMREGAVLPLDYRKLTTKQREKWQLAMALAADQYGVEDVVFVHGKGEQTGMRPYSLLLWLLDTCVFDTASETARHLGVDRTTVRYHTDKINNKLNDDLLQELCEKMLR